MLVGRASRGHSPSAALAARTHPWHPPIQPLPRPALPPLPGGCTTPWSTGGRRSPSHLRWARSSTSLFRWGVSGMWWHPRVARGHHGLLCGAACFLANSVSYQQGQPLPAPASRSPVSPSIRPACSLRHRIALPAPACVQPFIPEFGSHHHPEPGHAHHSELEKVGGQLFQRFRLTGLAAPEQREVARLPQPACLSCLSLTAQVASPASQSAHPTPHSYGARTRLTSCTRCLACLALAGQTGWSGRTAAVARQSGGRAAANG